MTKLHPEVEAVTARVVERSRDGRRAYLDLIAREREAGVHRGSLACGMTGAGRMTEPAQIADFAVKLLGNGIA